ncbi:MAG TPA: molybdopterin-guanine dinucleotide biosynthesis protein B [Negativicutes bacterium]|nr:molybdopterin-guanine dinucleotide biosynthesis protein B [Negativicutes bacterium]
MRIVSIFGYSTSGKTTTVECLIRELINRGYTVGTVKDIHYEQFAIDTDGSNTDRHSKAGAEPVTARGFFETDILFKKRMSIPDILKIYTQDFVILEGVTDFEAPKILCASSLQDIEKRMAPDVIAISGVIANELKEYGRLPVINGMKQVEKLANLVERDALIWENK